jgi:transcription elongation GreA/GreB family factor
LSRAFTRDGQEGEDGHVLPERPVSSERNFVTARGLALIERELHQARDAFAAAQVAGDRIAMGNASRDIRYWAARRASADMVEPVSRKNGVRFGMAVKLAYADGQEKTWRIVGEDEAEASAGRISHVSPLAKALFGREIGDEVKVGPQAAEIIGIDLKPEK